MKEDTMQDKEYNRTFRLERHTPESDVVASLTVTLRERCAPTITKSARPEDVGQPAPFHTVDHREIMSYTELSVMGSLRSNGYDSAGQCVDEVADLFPKDSTVQRIRHLWREWHLNGMTAGCAHQGADWTCTKCNREQGWPVTYERYGQNPYPKRGDECDVCGRNRWDEPSDTCPVSGYHYGTRWLVRELPPEIESEIRGLIDED